MSAEELTCREKYPQLMLESQLCFPLYAGARHVVNQYTPHLKPLGLTYTQYIAFLCLWEYGEITVGELCRRLYLDNGTVTPLLKKMEQGGYVSRVHCPEDERVVLAAAANLPLILYADRGAVLGCLHIARRLQGLKMPLLRIR